MRRFGHHPASGGAAFLPRGCRLRGGFGDFLAQKKRAPTSGQGANLNLHGGGAASKKGGARRLKLPRKTSLRKYRRKGKIRLPIWEFKASWTNPWPGPGFWDRNSPVVFATNEKSKWKIGSGVFWVLAGHDIPLRFVEGPPLAVGINTAATCHQMIFQADGGARIRRGGRGFFGRTISSDV